MQKMKFFFEKNPKRFGHNDFVFETLDKKIYKSVDTYYFALDNNFLENNESQEKVVLTLIAYLNILIQEVEKLSICGDQLLFPIDFSDEYIGFLMIFKDDKDYLLINYGITTSLQGYSYYPTNFKDFPQNIDVDHVDKWNYQITIIDFISNIEDSIQNLNRQL